MSCSIVPFGYELDFKRVYWFGGPMFQGKHQTILLSGKIDIGISKSVKIGTSSQRWAGLSVMSFTGMMDQDDRGLMTSLQFTQKTKIAGDIGGTVFIQAVEPYQGIQQ